MSLQAFVASAAAGYLLGAIPFAVIVARRYGVDILKAGSGNPGATNVKRVVGKGPGNVVFALDFLKGFVAAGWPLLVWPGAEGGQLAVLGLVAAILGHSFSVFIRFRGGKGVATTMGGLLACMPVVVLIGLLVWVVAFYGTRFVSVASLLFGVSLPVSAALLPKLAERLGSGSALLALPSLYFWFAVLLAVLIVVRHRENIKRLCAGTEHRFVKEKK